MAKALRLLGYTVYDFFDHVDYHFNHWRDLYCSGKSPDFASMYQGVDAVTDLPAAFWYEEIFEAFPEAKVVLTIRDNEEVWVQSYSRQNEILQNLGCLVNLAVRKLVARTRKALFVVDRMWLLSFGGLKPESTLLYKKKYRQHNDRVQAVIPKEKLLVFNVKEGWEPLCEFLGCDVPKQAFPRENIKGSFSKDEISKALYKFIGEIFMGVAILIVFAGVVLLCL